MNELPVLEGLTCIKETSFPNDFGLLFILLGALFTVVNFISLIENIDKRNMRMTVLSGVLFAVSVAVIILGFSPLMEEHTYLAVSDGFPDLVEIQQFFEILKVEGLTFTLKPLF